MGLCFSPPPPFFHLSFLKIKVTGVTHLHYSLLTCCILEHMQSHFDIWQLKIIALLKIEGKLAGLVHQPI